MTMITALFSINGETDRMRKCPKCGSSKSVIKIVYGYPGVALAEDEREGKLILGGCCEKLDAPQWHCKECQHEWNTLKTQPEYH